MSVLRVKGADHIVIDAKNHYKFSKRHDTRQSWDSSLNDISDIFLGDQFVFGTLEIEKAVFSCKGKYWFLMECKAYLTWGRRLLRNVVRAISNE